MRELLHYSILLQIITIAICQRVAPGVPPQQYNPQQQQYQPQQQYQAPGHQQQVHQQQIHQQQVHQQQVHQQQVHQQPPQYQQVPVQQQHVPVQQQHVPVQQHQVPVQHQQVPVQQQGHGHEHHISQGVLNAANIQQEKDHIAEHMEVPIDTSKMSEQELQFHYFKMHDADNNNKLDGCELIKSLIHWHEQGSKEPHGAGGQGVHVEEKVFSDEELVALIDPILAMDDASRDGFIDYPEFVRAQQKAASNQPKP